jgi:hypothetical protein
VVDLRDLHRSGLGWRITCGQEKPTPVVSRPWLWSVPFFTRNGILDVMDKARLPAVRSEKRR